jgi:hypothetical protein
MLKNGILCMENTVLVNILQKIYLTTTFLRDRINLARFGKLQ